MSEDKKRLELDYVRALSMLSIIVIHVTSTFVYAESGMSVAGMNPAFLLNQLVRYAVPLFILLSGLTLGFSRSAGTVLPFFKTRFTKILLPYLFWSCAYWLVSYRHEGPGSLIRALLRGGAAPHLYFIATILQLYLLYPLLRRPVRRYPVPLLAVSLLLSLASQQAYVLSGQGLFPRGPLLENLWFLFPTWIFYFVLGMVIHQSGVERLCARCGDHLPFLLCLGLCAGLLLARESFFTGNLDSIKVSLFFYTPLIFAVFLGLGNKLKSCPVLNRTVGFLAAHSQSVFFLHLFVLALLRKIPLLVTGMRGMVLLLLAETALSIPAAWLFDLLVGQLKRVIFVRRRSDP